MSNLAINGSHLVSQAYGTGLEVTGIGGDPVNRQAAYITDQWTLRVKGNMVGKAGRFESPYYPGYRHMLRASCTTAETPLASTAYAQITTVLEGIRTDCLRYGLASAYPVSIAFQVRASKAGTYCLSLSNFARDRTYVCEYTITTAGTPQWVAIPDIPPDTGGTWDQGDATVGLRLQWNLCSGSAVNTTTGWHAGEVYGTSNQVNLFDTVGAYFEITGLLVLPGDTLPAEADAPCWQRAMDEEWDLCQRYRQKTWGQETLIGAATGLGALYGHEKNGGGAVIKTVQFPRPLMRPGSTWPSLSLVPYDMAGNANCITTSAGNGQTGYTVSAFNERAFTISYPSVDWIRFHYDVSCRL